MFSELGQTWRSATLTCDLLSTQRQAVPLPVCFDPSLTDSTLLLSLLQAVVEEDCMPMEQFAQHLLPSLLSLSSDPVANVRVLVAKALRQSVMEKGTQEQPVHRALVTALRLHPLVLFRQLSFRAATNG